MPIRKTQKLQGKVGNYADIEKYFWGKIFPKIFCKISNVLAKKWSEQLKCLKY